MAHHRLRSAALVTRVLAIADDAMPSGLPEPGRHPLLNARYSSQEGQGVVNEEARPILATFLLALVGNRDLEVTFDKSGQLLLSAPILLRLRLFSRRHVLSSDIFHLPGLKQSSYRNGLSDSSQDARSGPESRPFVRRNAPILSLNSVNSGEFRGHHTQFTATCRLGLGRCGRSPRCRMLSIRLTKVSPPSGRPKIGGHRTYSS